MGGVGGLALGVGDSSSMEDRLESMRSMDPLTLGLTVSSFNLACLRFFHRLRVATDPARPMERPMMAV